MTIIFMQLVVSDEASREFQFEKARKHNNQLAVIGFLRSWLISFNRYGVIILMSVKIISLPYHHHMTMSLLQVPHSALFSRCPIATVARPRKKIVVY